MPTTSNPRSTSRAAVTDESTPPDIATTTRWLAGSPGRSRSGKSRLGRLTGSPPTPSAKSPPRAGRRRRKCRRERRSVPHRRAAQTDRRAPLPPREPAPGNPARHTFLAIRGSGCLRAGRWGRRYAPRRSRHSRRCTVRAPLRDRGGPRRDHGRAQSGYTQWLRPPLAHWPSPLPTAPSGGNSRHGALSQHRGWRRRGAARGAFRRAHRICRSPGPRHARNGSKRDNPAPNSIGSTPRAARRWPAGARTGGGYSRANPGRTPRPDARRGLARSFADGRSSAEQQVAGRRGKLHCQTVELLADDDLATEARRHREVERQVEHVLLVLARLVEQLVPLRIDDDMAGRAGERAFASAFDVDLVAARDFEHRHSKRRVDFAPGAVALDKSHFRHYSGRGARSSAKIAAVSAAFAPAGRSAFRMSCNPVSPAASAAS